VNQTKPEIPASESSSAAGSGFVAILLWAAAVVMIGLAVFMAYQRVFDRGTSAGVAVANAPLDLPPAPQQVSLPLFQPETQPVALHRRANLRTILPTRPREQEIVYRVQAGDSVFGIAQSFNLKPETVLWANYDILNDDPHMISIGQELIIRPAGYFTLPR
jgi:hypothetical protein